MEIVRQKKGWIRQSLPIFIGLAIVLVALFNFYFIINGIYGKIKLHELSPNIKSLKALFYSQKPKAAILNSTYTRNLLPKNSTWLKDNITTWQKFINNFDFDFEVVSDNILETTDLSDYNLLILAGTKSLSDKQIIKIKKYLEQGGSVLATSGTASYSSDGKWRGWQFFSEVFGIRFSKEINNDELSKIHTIRGGLPLTADIPAGYALQIATWDRPIAAEVLDPRTIQLSYWYNYNIERGLMREEIKKSAGIVYGSYGKGRFLWMGFEINSVIGSNTNHIFLERLIKNSLNWLSRNPIAYVRDWPNNYTAGAVILPYLEEDLSSTGSLLEIVKSKQVSPTFIIEQNQIRKDNEETLKLLSRFGEIIPSTAFGYPASAYDSSNNLFDYNTQQQNLNKLKAKLNEVTDQKIDGILPLFGLFDKNTLRALTKSNLAYLISDSSNGNSLPKIFWYEKNKIIGLNKSSRDDFDIVKNYGLTDSIFQFYTYQEDIDRLAFEGGLYLLKAHSSYQLQSKYLNVLSKLIDDLREKNFWITTAREVSRWFNTKSQIEVGVKKIGSRRVRLTVSNPSDAFAERIEIDADLSEEVSNVVLSAEIIGTEIPNFKKLNKGSLIRLTINELKPHESRIYYIDYENTKNI